MYCQTCAYASMRAGWNRRSDAVNEEGTPGLEDRQQPCHSSGADAFSGICHTTIFLQRRGRSWPGDALSILLNASLHRNLTACT